MSFILLDWCLTHLGKLNRLLRGETVSEILLVWFSLDLPTECKPLQSGTPYVEAIVIGMVDPASSCIIASISKSSNRQVEKGPDPAR
jgi:hypothetical protein